MQQVRTESEAPAPHFEHVKQIFWPHGAPTVEARVPSPPSHAPAHVVVTVRVVVRPLLVVAQRLIREKQASGRQLHERWPCALCWR